MGDGGGEMERWSINCAMGKIFVGKSILLSIANHQYTIHHVWFVMCDL
jgi:hypothetical protein